MKEKSVDGHKPKNDKIKHNTEKSGDNNKPNGTPNDGRVTKKSERKAMRIGDYALIVEIKDQGKDAKKEGKQEAKNKGKLVWMFIVSCKLPLIYKYLSCDMVMPVNTETD